MSGLVAAYLLFFIVWLISVAIFAAVYCRDRNERAARRAAKKRFAQRPWETLV